jgi:hypothetical protein
LPALQPTATSWNELEEVQRAGYDLGTSTMPTQNDTGEHNQDISIPGDTFASSQESLLITNSVALLGWERTLFYK